MIPGETAVDSSADPRLHQHVVLLLCFINCSRTPSYIRAHLARSKSTQLMFFVNQMKQEQLSPRLAPVLLPCCYGTVNTCTNRNSLWVRTSCRNCALQGSSVTPIQQQSWPAWWPISHVHLDRRGVVFRGTPYILRPPAQSTDAWSLHPAISGSCIPMDTTVHMPYRVADSSGSARAFEKGD